MEAVLFDIQVAESYSALLNQDSLHRTNVKNIDSLSFYYQMIFDRHHITQEEFTKSMEWYTQHPEELEKIYAHLLTKLEKDKPQQKADERRHER